MLERLVLYMEQNGAWLAPLPMRPGMCLNGMERKGARPDAVPNG